MWPVARRFRSRRHRSRREFPNRRFLRSRCSSDAIIQSTAY
jgi:hypothetical protein